MNKTETIGNLVKRKMLSELVHSVPDIPLNIFEDFLNDKYWPNRIPIMTFRNMLRLLNIDFETAKQAIYFTLPILPKSSTELNTRPALFGKTAVDKYVSRLGEIMSSPTPAPSNNPFNDKNIGKTIKDLPEQFTWEDLFEIGKGIPTGTQNFLKTYFNLPTRKTESAPSNVQGVEELAKQWVKDNIPDELEDTAEEQYCIDAFIAGSQSQVDVSGLMKALEKLCSRVNDYFKERTTNPKNKNSGIANAHNLLAFAYDEAKKYLSNYQSNAQNKGEQEESKKPKNCKDTKRGKNDPCKYPIGTCQLCSNVYP